VTLDSAQATAAAMLLAAFRTTAWLFIAPPFSSSGMPRTVKVMFGVLLAGVVAPTLNTDIPAVSDTGAFLASALLQIFTGAALGFGVRLIFSAVEAAGSLLDVTGGFSLSFALDPMGNQNASVLSRFHAMLATVLMLVTPAHQYVLLGFLHSFRGIPLDATVAMGDLAHSLTGALSAMFVAALQIAGPMLLVLFLADIALGLMNRIAPQLNAFSLSFPLKIILTLTLLGLTFGLLPDIVGRLGNQASALLTLLAA
jgi:flagellar biosynthetic protein FliR